MMGLLALLLLAAACGKTEPGQSDEALPPGTASPSPTEYALDTATGASPTVFPSLPTWTPEPPTPTPTTVPPTPTVTPEPPTSTPTTVPPTPTDTPEPPTPTPTTVPPTPTDTPEPPTPIPTPMPSVTIEVTAESATEMVITWSHNLDSPVDQEIYRDDEIVAAPAPDQSSYGDSKLDPNRRYMYRIVLRRGDEVIAMDEAAAATLAHTPGVAGPFDVHKTGFSLAIVDAINPPETAYKVTVWNEEWHLNAKHYSDWGTSRCRTFEDLPTGLPFEFEVVARNLDGVRTLPVRRTVIGKERLALSPNNIESGSGKTPDVDEMGDAQKCQVLEALQPYDIESVPALLLLSGFSTGALESALVRPWVDDGLDGPELEAIGRLGEIAATDEAAALRILAMPFLETVEPHDVESMGELLSLSEFSAGALEAILARPWMEDGLDETERQAIDRLGDIAAMDEAAALQILGMPFLETVEPFDAGSMAELMLLPGLSLGALESILARPWMEDGLDETERQAIDRLGDIAAMDEAAALQILAMPFLEGIDADDVAALDSLLDMAGYGPALLGEVVNLAWIADGLDEIETGLVRDLGRIAAGDEAVALNIVGMPFLQAAELRGDLKASAVSALWALGAHSQEALGALIERTWVEDGAGESVVALVRALGWIASRDEAAALRIIGMPFLKATELRGDSEALAVNALWVLAANSLEVLGALVDMTWAEDGLDESEVAVTRNLAWIARTDEAAALRILAMPFLETVEPVDGIAMTSLGGLASFRQQEFQRVMSHPTLSGGISGDWPKVDSLVKSRG